MNAYRVQLHRNLSRRYFPHIHSTTPRRSRWISMPAEAANLPLYYYVKRNCKISSFVIINYPNEIIKTRNVSPSFSKDDESLSTNPLNNFVIVKKKYFPPLHLCNSISKRLRISRKRIKENFVRSKKGENERGTLSNSSNRGGGRGGSDFRNDCI